MGDLGSWNISGRHPFNDHTHFHTCRKGLMLKSKIIIYQYCVFAHTSCSDPLLFLQFSQGRARLSHTLLLAENTQSMFCVWKVTLIGNYFALSKCKKNFQYTFSVSTTRKLPHSYDHHEATLNFQRWSQRSKSTSLLFTVMLLLLLPRSFSTTQEMTPCKSPPSSARSTLL